MRSTVRLPSGESLDGRPWVVLNVGGKREVSSDRTEIAELMLSRDIRAVRRFKSHSTSRSTPQRPYLATMEGHRDVESELETIHAQLCDRQSNAIRIIPQPAWIRVLDWKCPDFAVVLPDGDIRIIEVKTRSQLRRPEVREDLLRVERAWASLDIRYEVVSELSIEALYNFNLFSYKARWQSRWGVEVEQASDEIVAMAANPVTLQDLWDTHLLPLPRLKSLIWHLLWRGALCLDWDEQILPDTEVWAHSNQCDGMAQHDWRVLCGPQTDGLHDIESDARQ